MRMGAMTMTMPGVTVKDIREAILNAFDEASLRQVLRMEMNLKLDVEIAPGALSNRVFELIEWSEMQGREVELITTLARGRPRNAKMQAIYAKYGLAIPVDVQVEGRAIATAPRNAAESGLERILTDHLDFLDFGIWREKMTAVEGQVCRIVIDGDERGTGFLIGPDLVLTNYHVMEPVLDDEKLAKRTQCEFDYKKLVDGSNLRTVAKLASNDWRVSESRYSQAEADGEPDRVAAADDELDYVVMRLSERIGEKPVARNYDPEDPPDPRGWIELPATETELPVRMGLMIAQHPEGRPLKLAIDTHAIDKEAGLWLMPGGTRVRYATNTEPGSSGSPCFDMQWNLVALHHYGDSLYEHPRFNQGVPIWAIGKRLTEAGIS